MFYSVALIWVVCGFLVSNGLADEDDDLVKMNPEFMLVFEHCVVENKVSAGDFENVGKKELEDNERFNCMLACVFKKTGVMNEKGELSVEGSRAATKKFLGDDPESMRNSEAFTEACISVNSVDVQDDPNGCKRARLIYKCSVDNKTKFALVKE